MGEIDIIAREKHNICFVEVKTRSNTMYGTPSQSVSKKKMDNIRKLAVIYLKNKNMFDCPMRFDVIEVYIRKIAKKIISEDINHINNAF